jgi:hypothetical protein
MSQHGTSLRSLYSASLKQEAPRLDPGGEFTGTTGVILLPKSRPDREFTLNPMRLQADSPMSYLSRLL